MSAVWADQGSCLVVRSEIDGPDADLDYIATMHPGVALALADWMDERAKDYVGKADECLRVARLINA